MKRARPTPSEQREKARLQIRRKALRTLAKARTAADRAGVELSDWEDAFLGSLTERLTTYGRGFNDPEKGAPGAAFSVRQVRKLKEIKAKSLGEAVRPAPRRESDEES